MKPFKFKLEKVLDHKKTVEDERKGQFSCAERQCRDNEQVLDDLKKKEENLVDTLRAVQSGVMNVSDMVLNYNHFLSLEQKITGQSEKVQQLREKVSDCRQQLIAAKKEKEILEKIKDKQHQGYVRETNRQEQKVNDEIGIHRFNRREKS